MISLYRWQSGQKHGTWVEFAGAAGECDRRCRKAKSGGSTSNDPTEEEEDLVFRKFLPVHPLTLEDITRARREPDGPPHLPKVEEFADYLFVIVNPLRPGADSEPATGRMRTGARCVVQLSAVLTEQVLITHHYQAAAGSRAMSSSSCRRHTEQAGRGPDYLFHLVLDRIVDEFAPEIDRLVERLDRIEVEVLDEPVAADACSSWSA